MTYQVREKGIMSDAPMSELFNTREEAVAALETIKAEKGEKHPFFKLYIYTNRYIERV